MGNTDYYADIEEVRQPEMGDLEMTIRAENYPSKFFDSTKSRKVEKIILGILDANGKHFEADSITVDAMYHGAVKVKAATPFHLGVLLGLLKREHWMSAIGVKVAFHGQKDGGLKKVAEATVSLCGKDFEFVKLQAIKAEICDAPDEKWKLIGEKRGNNDAFKKFWFLVDDESFKIIRNKLDGRQAGIKAETPGCKTTFGIPFKYIDDVSSSDDKDIEDIVIMVAADYGDWCKSKNAEKSQTK